MMVSHEQHKDMFGKLVHTLHALTTFEVDPSVTVDLVLMSRASTNVVLTKTKEYDTYKGGFRVSALSDDDITDRKGE